jgi:hypothetical protein
MSDVVCRVCGRRKPHFYPCDEGAKDCRPARPAPGDVEAAFEAVGAALGSHLVASDRLIATPQGQVGQLNINAALFTESNAKVQAAVRAYGDARAAQEKARADAIAEKVQQKQERLAELARATRAYLSLCSCDPPEGFDIDLDEALAEADSEGPMPRPPWSCQSEAERERDALAEKLREVREVLGDLLSAVEHDRQTTSDYLHGTAGGLNLRDATERLDGASEKALAILDAGAGDEGKGSGRG